MAAGEEKAQGEKMKMKMEGVKLVLLDIEGTVCPISYVKDTLFPYATSALPSVLATHWDDDTFKPYRDAAPEEARKSPETYLAAVQELSAANSKISWLKNLQGYLWEDGYKTGAYSTPLFPDVAKQLRRWREERGLEVAIYSSGSVFAQKLLFGYVQAEASREGDVGEKRKRGREEVEDGIGDGEAETENLAEEERPTKKRVVVKDGEEAVVGADKDDDDVDATATTTGSEAKAPKPTTEDLTCLFSGWFDTVNAGPKMEAKSYETIAKEMKMKAQEIMFFSDNVKEIEAALQANMKAVLVDRPGNAPVEEAHREKYRMVNSLEEVEL